MSCRPVILCLLNCVTKTIQVTEGCKYFPRMPHAACEPQVGYSPIAYCFGSNLVCGTLTETFFENKFETHEF